MSNHVTLGGSTGDSLATASSIHTPGTVRYVDSVTGSDANGGLSKLDPKATLASAIGASSAGDIIGLLATHDEEIFGDLNVNVQVTIVGMGSSGGIPTPRLRMASGGVLLGTDGTQLRGVRIDGSDSSGNIQVTAEGIAIVGCYLPLSSGTAIVLGTGADYVSIRDTTIVSTAERQDSPASNAPPASGLSGSVTTQLELDGVTFDGGEIGFSGNALSVAGAAIPVFRADNISMLRGADYVIGGNSASLQVQGYIHVASRSGAVTGNWVNVVEGGGG